MRPFKSAAVPLTPVYRAAALAAAGAAAAAAAACEQTPPALPPDPCARVTFNADACEDAQARQGYYYHGTWVPHVYPMPYAFYLGAFNRYAAGGGRYVTAPPSVYAPGYRPQSARAASYLDRVSGGGGVRVTDPSLLGPAYATGAGRPGAPVVTRGGFGQTGATAGTPVAAGARRGLTTNSAFAVATDGHYGGRHGAVAGSRYGGASRLGGGIGRAYGGVSHPAGGRAVSRGGFGSSGGRVGGFGRGG